MEPPSVCGLSAETILAQQFRYRRQPTAYVLLFRQGKRDELNNLQNSIISPHQVHCSARRGQAVARGYQRLRRAGQRQATLHFLANMRVRDFQF